MLGDGEIWDGEREEGVAFGYVGRYLDGGVGWAVERRRDGMGGWVALWMWDRRIFHDRI
jgi:hypothetical protein